MKKYDRDLATFIRNTDQFPKDAAYYLVMWSLPLLERGIEPHERSRSQYDFLWGMMIVAVLCTFVMSLRLIADPGPVDATVEELFTVILITLGLFIGGLALALNNLHEITMKRYTWLVCPRIKANGLAKSHIYLFGLFSMSMMGLVPFFGLLIVLMGYSYYFMLSSVIASLIGLVFIQRAASRCWTVIETHLDLNETDNQKNS